MASTLKVDTEEIQMILDLDLEITDITKGVLYHELLFTRKSPQSGFFFFFFFSGIHLCVDPEQCFHGSLIKGSDQEGKNLL